MTRTVIIYAPDEEALRNPVEEMTDHLETNKHHVIVKTAKETHMPDLAAANIVLLGSKPSGSTPLHPEFKEIVRALKGINLAGRTAGLFSCGEEGSIAAFQKALEDCNIDVCNHELHLREGKTDSGRIIEWLDQIISCYKDGNKA